MRRLLWYLKLVQYIFLTKCPFQKGNCLDNANIFLSLERPLEIELYWWKWITFSLLAKLRLWLRQYPISRGTKKSLLSLWLFFRGLCSLQKDWQDAGRRQNGDANTNKIRLKTARALQFWRAFRWSSDFINYAIVTKLSNSFVNKRIDVNWNMTYDLFTLHQLFLLLLFIQLLPNSTMKTHKVEMLNKPLLLSLL